MSSNSKENIKGNPQLRKITLPNVLLRINNSSLLKSNKYKSVVPLYKEDIVYQSKPGDFLRLQDAQRLSLLTRLDLNTMKSHTVARLTSANKLVWEKTSDYIASIIGQDNYDIVFSSLCSVISQEFKVRAILALLSERKKPTEKESQCSQSGLSDIKVMIDREVQTEESCIGEVKKPQLRRSKRQVVPYVVTETIVPDKKEKVVVHPENFECFTKTSVKSENADSIDDSQISFLNSEHDSEHLSLLKCDDNSVDSIGNLSSFSIATTQELLNAPLSLVDRVTQPENDCTSLVMLDGTVINIPCKVEDDFHVATPEIMKVVPPEHRRKLLWYQAYTDWKYCLTKDDTDNLPIHLAVMNDDVHLLRRQCLVLKSRNESIDITNGDNLTALQMSILASSPLCTALLMQLGADPLVPDAEYRTCFHLAAEAGAAHLNPLIDKCTEDPLSVIRSSDELWKPEVALKSKENQVKYLLHKVCTMFDSQGYTPLMLASKLGKHDAVQVLVKAAPSSVDYRAISSGATALYLAVGAACTDSTQRGNKSKVFDHFKKTIEHLVEAGADPNIDNYSGSDVNALLADFNNSDLSMIIASKRTVVNCKEIDPKDQQPFMIVKENDGTLMNIKDQMKKNKEINRIKDELKKEVAVKGRKKRDKPIILKHKVLKPPIVVKLDSEAQPINVKLESMTQPIVATYSRKTQPKNVISESKVQPTDVTLKSINQPKNEYINTYRNFVSKMNVVVPENISRQRLLNEPKPSTSKSDENSTVVEANLELVKEDSDVLGSEILIEYKTIAPEEIKTEEIENSPVDTKKNLPMRVSKRKVTNKTNPMLCITPITSIPSPKKHKTA